MIFMVVQGAALPEWRALTDDQLRLWHAASLRADYDPADTPHANRWFLLFHLRGRHRESAQLWRETLVPWALNEGAPLHALLFVAMQRRLLHNPRSWNALWRFARAPRGGRRVPPVEGVRSLRPSRSSPPPSRSSPPPTLSPRTQYSGPASAAPGPPSAAFGSVAAPPSTVAGSRRASI